MHRPRLERRGFVGGLKEGRSWISPISSRKCAQIPDYRRYGRVTGVSGMLLEVGGVPQSLAVGGRCEVLTRDNRRVPCEVVGFRDRPRARSCRSARSRASASAARPRC